VVERGDFVRRVVAEGILEAVDATRLGPPAEITQPLKIAWLAPDGSAVRAGDVVIRFDPTELEQNLRDGSYDRAAADSRITQREVLEEGTLRNLERDADMASLELDYAESFQSKDARIFSRNEIISSEIDRDLAERRMEHADRTGGFRRELGRAEVELLEIERHKAELKIGEAREGLSALEVRAPHDGIFVLTQGRGRGTAEVGQMVWGGNAIAELPKLEQMQALVYVLEADAGGLRTGLPARVSLDAVPGVGYAATVSKSEALAQPRSRHSPVQYFAVTLRLERTDPRMKPGERVQAEITFEERADALTVPRQAIFEVEGERVAYRRAGRAFEPVPVTLGPSALGRVVVESGLAATDSVALRDPRVKSEPAVERERDAAVPAVGG
jgi:multidrug efflux pump subunit AcrA (membrane-fusion protein)